MNFKLRRKRESLHKSVIFQFGTHSWLVHFSRSEWRFRLYLSCSSPQGGESYGHVLGIYFYYSLCDLSDIEAFFGKLEKSFWLNSQTAFV